MGVGNSTTAFNASTTLNEIMTTVMQSSSQTCAQGNTSAQILTVGNLNTVNCNITIGNISQTSNIAPILQCKFSSTEGASMTAQVADKLKTAAKASLSGLSGALNDTSSANIDNACNQIMSNVNMSQIASSVQENMASQLLSVGTITATCLPGETLTFDNIEQKLLLAPITRITSTNVALSKSITNLQNVVDQASEGANTGISSTTIAIIAFLIILALCIGAYFYIKMK